MRCSRHPHWRRSSSTRPDTDRSAELPEGGFVRADPDSGRRLPATGHLGLGLRQARSGPNHPSTQSGYQPAARPCIPRTNPQSFMESFRRRRAKCTVGTSTISLSTPLLDPETCPRVNSAVPAGASRSSTGSTGPSWKLRPSTPGRRAASGRNAVPMSGPGPASSQPERRGARRPRAVTRHVQPLRKHGELPRSCGTKSREAAAEAGRHRRRATRPRLRRGRNGKTVPRPELRAPVLNATQPRAGKTRTSLNHPAERLAPACCSDRGTLQDCHYPSRSPTTASSGAGRPRARAARRHRRSRAVAPRSRVPAPRYR